MSILQLKHRRWLAGFALAAVLDGGLSFAATPASPEASPTDAGVFQARNPNTGADTALERITPIEWVHLRSVGAGGGSSYLEFAGGASPVRFKAAQTIEFTVHAVSTNGTGAGVSRLYTVDPKGDARVLDLAVTGFDGPDGWQSPPGHVLPLTARKLDGDLLQLVPTATLAPGEYCLSGPGTHDGFCFGVDP